MAECRIYPKISGHVFNVELKNKQNLLKSLGAE
jgi:hypothetical protein